jgi:hypothetical protein
MLQLFGTIPLFLAETYLHMTREDLQEQYAALSNNELLEIIDRKFDYTELAVTVALEEIGRRNLSEENIREYKEEQIAQVNSFIKKNIVDDLNVFYKILFFFIWLPLLNFPFKQNFRDDGYILKLRQASYYSLLGFVCMALTALSAEFAPQSNLTALTIWFLSFLPVYGFDEYFNRKRQIRKLRSMFGPPPEDPS